MDAHQHLSFRQGQGLTSILFDHSRRERDTILTTIGNYKRRRGELQKIGKHNDANKLSIRNSSEIWV